MIRIVPLVVETAKRSKLLTRVSHCSVSSLLYLMLRVWDQVRELGSCNLVVVDSWMILVGGTFFSLIDFRHRWHIHNHWALASSNNGVA